MQKTANFRQLLFIEGRQHPCRGAEARSHGPAFSANLEILQLRVDKVVDAPILQVVRVPQTSG